MKKRLLSMLLALVMVIGILPTAAMADSPEKVKVNFQKVVQGLPEESVLVDKDGTKEDICFNFDLYGPDGHKKEDFGFELEEEHDDYDDFSYDKETGIFTSKTEDEKLHVGQLYTLTENVDYPDEGYTGPTDYELTLVAVPEDNADLTKINDKSWTIEVYDNVTITAYNNYAPKPTYTLTYDENGGVGGPDDVNGLTAQNDYTLATEPVPTHAVTADDVPVVFIGWTATEDTTIYTKDDTRPNCIITVDIKDDTTVYAVYGLDTNKDEIPDVLQTWVTMTFDANGGAWKEAVDGYTMGTENQTAAKEYVFGSEVEKISTEPVREGYEFVGWYHKNNQDELTDKWWAFETSKEFIYSDDTVYAKWDKVEQPPVEQDKKGTLLINLQDENGAALDNLVTLPITNSYTISTETGAGVDYVIPASVEAYGSKYIYEAVASGELTGNVTKDGQVIVVCLQYTKDDWNDEKDTTTGGDNIPDKYQAVVVYKSEDEDKGTVSLAQEVVTIQDETYPIRAAVGRLKIAGSTATPKTGYVFENWISALTFTGANAATLAKQTIRNVEGGKTYTFTAHFVTAVPGLNITKTLKSVGGVEVASTTAAPMAKVGDEIVWIITVNNSGNCDLSKIPVKDVLKDEKGNELTGVSVRPIGTYGNYGDELGTSWTIETLPVGQTSEYIVTYKVTAADAGKTLTNSAVSGETTGNAPGVTVENGALNVVKTVDKTTAKVDDKLTYTIKVTNTGNTTLTGIVLTDAMLNVTETIDTLEPGTSWIESYEYTVKTADAGKTIVNTAVAKASDGTTGSDSSEGTKVQSTQIHVPTLNKKDHVAYIIGYEDNTVRPENNITRAEVATIFFRLLTDDSRARFWSQTNDFSDVSANDWFNNAVSTMANAGVLTGYPDGTFKPNAPITRAEFAAIAARFSDVTYNGKCSFTDVAATYWAADEIALAEHLGWITGYPDDTFRPSRNITRAEAMTLINRVLERAVEEEHMLKNMVKWIDNSPNAWYYEAVQEATNSHTYTRLSKKVPGQSFYYEDWVAILENPDWAALERAWSKANDQ